MTTPTFPKLSTREREVLQWLLDGKTDGDIAMILGLSAKTINFHVENAKRKLGASHRIRAIALALRAGVLRFPDSMPPDDEDGRRARPRLATPDTFGLW